MPVHLEFIADDLGALAALLAPLSSDDVTLEFTQQGDVYISIDMRGQTPEEAEPTPGDVIGQVADESPSSSSWAAELAATTAATTAADVDEPEPDAERVEEVGVVTSTDPASDGPVGGPRRRVVVTFPEACYASGMTNTYPPRAIPATARRWILLVQSDEGAQFWQLRVEGQSGIVAQVRRRGAFGPPPAVLTEGLPFRPEYHSHESEVEGEPDVWVYVPGERRRVDLAWVSLIIIGLSAALASRWPLFVVPAVLAAVWFLVLYRRDRKAQS